MQLDSNMRYRHPTIVIGLGSYALQLMLNFLGAAAARGELRWDELGEVGEENERRLLGLSFVWIRDPTGPANTTDDSSIGKETALELFDELREQIEIIDGASG